VSSEQYAHDSHRPSHRIRWRSRQLRTPWRFKARGTRRGSDTFGPQLTASLGDLWGLPSESAVAALLGNCLIDVNSLSVPAWSWRATNLRKQYRVAHWVKVPRPLTGSSGAATGRSEAGRLGRPAARHTTRLPDFSRTSGDAPAREEGAASDGADGGDASTAAASSSGPSLSLPSPAPSPAHPPLPVDPWLTPPHTAPQRVADTRRQPMRLSAQFEEFCHFLRVEQEATPATIATYRCFRDYEAFVMRQVGGTVFVTHFTAETCRNYQYDLAGRGLKSNTIRVRLATLGSFGKWAVRRDKLVRNPLDQLTRPRRRSRVPAVPTWKTVQALLQQCTLRERAILTLMAHGGLRRGEVVALDVGDVAPDFGLRRVKGKGGHEVPVVLPAATRAILREYLATERAAAAATAPLFVVTYKRQSGQRVERRISGQRLWKLVKAVGMRAGIPALHPHAFRHACAVELLRRTKNLRVVQEHLRHEDVQTTTGYTKITQQDVQQALETFDNDGE